MTDDDTVELLADALCIGCRTTSGDPCSYHVLRAQILLPALTTVFLAHFNIFPRHTNDD